MRQFLLLTYIMAGTALAHPTTPDRVDPYSEQVVGVRTTSAQAAEAQPSPNGIDNRTASNKNRFCVTTPKGNVNCVLLPPSGH